MYKKNCWKSFKKYKKSGCVYCLLVNLLFGESHTHNERIVDSWGEELDVGSWSTAGADSAEDWCSQQWKLQWYWWL